MKKSALLALALLAGSLSANATTIYVTLSLDSAYGQPGNVLLGSSAVGNNIGLNSNLTTGTNLGSGQTYNAITVLYKLSSAFDLNTATDITADYKAGAYTITNVTNLDVSVLYRDATGTSGFGGGDAATEAWTANITDDSFNTKQAGVVSLTPTTMSSTNDSLQNISLVDANVGSTLENYIIARAGTDALGIQVVTTDGNWRLRGMGGNLTIQADAIPTTGTPEPATMGLVGFAMIGAGVLARRRK